MKKWIIIGGSIVAFFICLLISLILMEDDYSSIYWERNTNVNLNKVAYYETDEARQAFQNTLSATSIWSSSSGISNSNKNYNIVFGEISAGAKAYLEDIYELYEEMQAEASANPDIFKYGCPPIWVFLGIAKSESSNTVDIGGVTFPSFLKDYSGSSIDNYKKGELFTKQGVDTKGLYYGVFQMTTDALDVGKAKYFPNSTDTEKRYDTRAQWYSLMHFHSNPSGKYSYTANYTSIPGFKEEWLWVLSCHSHLTTAARAFPYDMSQYWMPFLEEALSERYTDALLEANAHTLSLAESRSYYTGLAIYCGVIAAKKTGSQIYVGSVSSSAGTYVPYGNGTADTFFNINIMKTLLPDFESVVGTWTTNGSTLSGSLFKKYIYEEDLKGRWANVSNSSYRSNGSGVIFLEVPNGSPEPQNYGFVLSAVGAGHLLAPALLGDYLEAVMDIALGKASPTSNSIVTTDSTVSTRAIASDDLTPSIYYSEYNELSSGSTRNITEPVAIQSYNNVNSDTVETLLEYSLYDNGNIVGSFEEIGWKGQYPIFSQTNTTSSQSARMLFNNQETTLSDAGCSIYALVSMLHGIGLGSTPVPISNNLSNGLNAQGFITPSEIAKLVSAPIIPSKLEDLGYTVETQPMTTDDDIRNLMKIIQRYKYAYMVNTKSSTPIRALNGNNEEVYRSFTSSGHFILVTNVISVNGKLYFEVVDSITSNETVDSNRLYYDLEDAISKGVLGRSSTGGIVPAFRITGISQNTETTNNKIQSLVSTLPILNIHDETLIQVSDNYIRVFVDNVNYIHIPTKVTFSSGIYSNQQINVGSTTYSTGQYINGTFTEYDYTNINNHTK